MNGKGDTNRTKDYKQFYSNYDRIDWHKKVPETFKTTSSAEQLPLVSATRKRVDTVAE
jgi:hypothetical protein